MSFAPVRRLRVAEQIAGTIREAIVGGRFRPGQTLPSERDLADQFDVNRGTVREAMQRLEAWGLVEMRHGGGTMVRDFLVDAGFQLLPFLLAPGGAPDPALLGDLLDMRVMLLGWTARKAAERPDPAAVGKLRDALTALKAATTAEGVQERDFAFFETMVDMTGNRVLGLLSNAVRHIYLENRALFVLLYAPGAFDLIDHQRAVDAIAAGDPDAAAAAMTACGARALALFRPEGAAHVR